MPTAIKLALTQEHITSAYTFEMTDVNVYSFEEALYHFFYKWKESQKDFLSAKFIDWVNNTLKLPDIANDIFNMQAIKDLSEKYVAFLSVIDYFDEEELDNLQNEIKSYETELMSNQLKETGDKFFKEKEYEKAIKTYDEAISFKPNHNLYNNIGLSFSQMGNYETAIEYFKKAFKIVSNDQNILFNYAEALIYNNDLENVTQLVNHVTDEENKAYLEGKIYLKTDNYIHAVNSFKKAHEISKDDFYLYEIIEIYENLGIYNSTLQYLEKIQNRDNKYLIRLSNVLSETENIDAAINYMEKATQIAPNNVNMWRNLAKFYRKKEDYFKAEEALKKAISLDNNNEKVLLEKAMLSKDQGKVKDYQLILSNILENFKEDYRKASQV